MSIQAVVKHKATNIEKAMMQIITDEPFFASVLLQKEIKANNNIPTLAVNVKGDIMYNEQFIEQLSVPNIVFALCHECMHYMWMHMVRRKSRDAFKFNIACDGVINETLAECGHSLMDGVVRWSNAQHKSAERVYEEMFEEGNEPPPQGRGLDDGDDDGDGDDGGSGAPGDGQSSDDDTNGSGSGQTKCPIGNDLDESGTEGLSEGERELLKEQVKVEITQAKNAAKQMGKMHGLLERMVEDIVNTKTPWPEILQQFYTATSKDDITYKHLDRRFIARGMRLPTADGVGMGEAALIVDVSGSITQFELNYFGGEFNSILECCTPDKLHLIYCHSRVVESAVETFEPTDYPVELRSPESGGTDMTAGIDYVLEHFPNVESIVILTDGYTPFGEEISIPVVWAITEHNITAPWGETIHIDMEA